MAGALWVCDFGICVGAEARESAARFEIGLYQGKFIDLVCDFELDLSVCLSDLC